MRFLVDNSLSPRMAQELRAAGHDAVHVHDLGLSSADDETIFTSAAEDDRILVVQDTDFATLLAIRRASRPSVILFRRRAKSTDSLLEVMLGNLPRVAADIEAGSVIVLEDARLRVRRLPITG